MMAAVSFAPGVFYECKGRTEFLAADVEQCRLHVLQDGDHVRCSEIVFRKGGRGRGLYAKLHYKRKKTKLVLYHRVSKNHIGSGDWEELNEMVVLALAADLPLD
jgi:hypothetical protein